MSFVKLHVYNSFDNVSDTSMSELALREDLVRGWYRYGGNYTVLLEANADDDLIPDSVGYQQSAEGYRRLLSPEPPTVTPVVTLQVEYDAK